MSLQPEAILLTCDLKEKNLLIEILKNHLALTHTGNLLDMSALLRERDPDLLLCDWPFYAEGWREVLNAVDSYTPGMPVIVLSRHGGEREWIAALESGAFDLLSWPSPKPVVLAAVEQAMASHAARKQYGFDTAASVAPLAG
jgi:DNA-binding NtrC family response regulator